MGGNFHCRAASWAACLSRTGPSVQTMFATDPFSSTRTLTLTNPDAPAFLAIWGQVGTILRVLLSVSEPTSKIICSPFAVRAAALAGGWVDEAAPAGFCIVSVTRVFSITGAEP